MCGVKPFRPRDLLAVCQGIIARKQHNRVAKSPTDHYSSCSSAEPPPLKEEYPWHIHAHADTTQINRQSQRASSQSLHRKLAEYSRGTMQSGFNDIAAACVCTAVYVTNCTC